MRGWLLDTNVVSELRKPKPDSRVVNFIAAQPGETLFVTDVTLAEITFGIEQLGDATRRTDLRLWLERNLRPLFAGRILSITEDVIVRWKIMAVAGQKRGHTFGQPDLFIYGSDCGAAGFGRSDPRHRRIYRGWRTGIRSVGKRIPYQRQKGRHQSSGDHGSS